MMTGKTFDHGWYRRFLKRQPILSGWTSESTTKACNGRTRLFTTLSKVLIERKILSSRLFNMDETAFYTNKGSKRVVAVCGSRNVWHPDLSTGFTRLLLRVAARTIMWCIRYSFYRVSR
ncbi:hypothetical protein PF008_g1639 [Phytophthora fragariae]|uniref:HTH CENPB-type domain-containing protein n=1 Tax=Phytophthora fragariae TaxID=53985 RepID=A0A6G0SK51_9STRA|nr:hypothetical protein PF008_g1639 [Phytophthora fragariae]